MDVTGTDVRRTTAEREPGAGNRDEAPDEHGEHGEHGRIAAVPSLAAIDGHPVHPMVVPLPIGALSLVVASDLAYAATRDRFWARASSALTAAGIASALFAAAFGATDFLGRREIRRHPAAWLHAGGNLAAVGLSALSLAVRRDGRASRVIPAGLALSALTGTILLGTGWLGGELSYRHRIGVVPA